MDIVHLCEHVVQSADSSPRPWTLHSGWLPEGEARQWQKELTQRLDWQQPEVQVYGRRHPVPRLTAYLATAGVECHYSGTIHRSKGWPDWFVPLLQQVKHACSAEFNSCLLNLYRDGDDRMGWHADDEAENDHNVPIASLSLGATRDFCLRHRNDKTAQHKLALASGDLLIMHPGCQQQWMHGVPSRRRIRTARINLTFRRIHDR